MTEIYSAHGAPLSLSLLARAPKETKLILLGPALWRAASWTFELMRAEHFKAPDKENRVGAVGFRFPYSHIETDSIPWAVDPRCEPGTIYFLGRERRFGEEFEAWVLSAAIGQVDNIDVRGWK